MSYKKLNSPFKQHEEDLRVCGNVFHCGGASANLPSHNIAEQMDHVLFALEQNASDEQVKGTNVFAPRQPPLQVFT